VLPYQRSLKLGALIKIIAPEEKTLQAQAKRQAHRASKEITWIIERSFTGSLQGFIDIRIKKLKKCFI